MNGENRKIKIASDNNSWSEWLVNPDEIKNSPYYKQEEESNFLNLRNRMYQYEQLIKNSSYKEDGLMSDIIVGLSDSIFNISGVSPLEYIDNCKAHIEKHYEMHYLPNYELQMVYDQKTKKMVSTKNSDDVEYDDYTPYQEILDIISSLESSLLKIDWTMRDLTASSSKNIRVHGFWDSIKNYFTKNKDEEYKDDRLEQNESLENNVNNYDDERFEESNMENAQEEDFNDLRDSTDNNDIEEQLEDGFEEEFSYLDPIDKSYWDNWISNFSYYKKSDFYTSNQDNSKWRIIYLDIKRLNEIIQKSKFLENGNVHVTNLVYNLVYHIFVDEGKSPKDVLQEFLQHVEQYEKHYVEKYRYQNNNEQTYYLSDYDNLIGYVKVVDDALGDIVWEKTTQKEEEEVSVEENKTTEDLKNNNEEEINKNIDVEEKNKNKEQENQINSNEFSKEQENFMNNYKNAPYYNNDSDSSWKSIWFNLRSAYVQTPYEDHKDLINELFDVLTQYDESFDESLSPYLLGLDIYETINNSNLDNLKKSVVLTAINSANNEMEKIFNTKRKEEEIVDNRGNVNVENKKEQEGEKIEPQEESVQENQTKDIEEIKKQREQLQKIIEELYTPTLDESVIEAQEDFNREYKSSFFYDENNDDLWKTIYESLNNVALNVKNENVSDNVSEILYGVIEKKEKQAISSMNDAIESSDKLIEVLSSGEVTFENQNLMNQIIESAKNIKFYLETIVKNKEQSELPNTEEKEKEETKNVEDETKTNEQKLEDIETDSKLVDSLNTFKSSYSNTENPNYEKYQDEEWVSLYENIEKLSKQIKNSALDNYFSDLLSTLLKNKVDESYQAIIEQNILNNVGDDFDVIESEEYNNILNSLDEIIKSKDNLEYYRLKVSENVELGTKSERSSITQSLKSISDLCVKTSEVDFFEKLCNELSNYKPEEYPQYLIKIGEFQSEVNSLIDTSNENKQKISEEINEIGKVFSKIKVPSPNNNSQNPFGYKKIVEFLKQNYNLSKDEQDKLNQYVKNDKLSHYEAIQKIMNDRNVSNSNVTSPQTNNNSVDVVDGRDPNPDVSDLQNLFTTNVPKSENETEQQVENTNQDESTQKSETNTTQEDVNQKEEKKQEGETPKVNDGKEQVVIQKAKTLKQKQSEQYDNEFGESLNKINDTLLKLGVFFAKKSENTSLDGINNIYDLIINHDVKDLQSVEALNSNIISTLESIKSYTQNIETTSSNKNKLIQSLDLIKNEVNVVFSIKKSRRKKKEETNTEKKNDILQEQLDRIKENDSTFDFNSLEQTIKNPNFKPKS